MSHPGRPHPVPCACDVCTAWAKAIVGDGKPAPRQPSGLVRDLGVAEMVQKFVDIAVKATGLSADELRRRGEEMGEEFPQGIEQRADRETVVKRGVPEIHLEAIYDREPVDCDALKSVTTFLLGRQTLLILSGGVGIRKTGSACYALVRKPGVFVTADDLGRVAAAKDDESREAWQRARRAQVLVVDDLGGEYLDDKGWFFRVLNGLIDHRYGMKLKTIITTNVDSATFKQLYGDRIVDRLREAGRWVNLGGESVRKRATP